MNTALRGAQPGRNRVLASLPPAELERLPPHLEQVQLQSRQIVHQPHERIGAVYFPHNGLCSLLAFSEDNERTIEVANAGNEGMVGISVFLGADRAPFRVLCQIPGPAERMAAEALDELYGQLPVLHNALRRYAQALLAQMAQTAVCNLLHPVASRCARWLLLTHDRVGVDEFPLTHELLSQMLGVQRSSVSLAVRRLHDTGPISYRWGMMRIIDRPALEALACLCYRRIRDEYRYLLEQSDDV